MPASGGHAAYHQTLGASSVEGSMRQTALPKGDAPTSWGDVATKRGGALAGNEAHVYSGHHDYTGTLTSPGYIYVKQHTGITDTAGLRSEAAAIGFVEDRCVQLTGNLSIGGTKNFTGTLQTGGLTVASEGYALASAQTAQVGATNACVQLANTTQTVEGTKTFSGETVMSGTLIVSNAPTVTTHAANKAYVDQTSAAFANAAQAAAEVTCAPKASATFTGTSTFNGGVVMNEGLTVNDLNPVGGPYADINLGWCQDLNIRAVGAITIDPSNLPTTQPTTAGHLWNDNGTLKIKT